MNIGHSASFSRNTHSKLHKKHEKAIYLQLQRYNDFTSRSLSPWPMYARYLELSWVCAIYKNWCVVAMVVLISDFVFGHAIFTVSDWSVRHVWHYSGCKYDIPPIIVPWPPLVWTPDYSGWGRRKGLGNNLAQTGIP